MIIAGFFFLFMIAVIIFVLHIAVCVWVYRDTIRRGKSQEYALLFTALVLAFPIMGIVIYFITRN